MNSGYSCELKLYISSGDWWWQQMDGRNGKQVGGSTEGYKNRAMAFKNMCNSTGAKLPKLKGRLDSYWWQVRLGPRATRVELSAP